MSDLNLSNAMTDQIRPSLSMNKEIVASTTAYELGALFDLSFNAKLGVLGRSPAEVDRLLKIAEKMLQVLPKSRLPYVNILIIDNDMDLRSEVLAGPHQLTDEMSEEQIKKLKSTSLSFLNHAIQKGCIVYAHWKDPEWNKDEMRNELEKLKDYVVRVGMNETHDESKTKKIAHPLLFSKKKGTDNKEESDTLQQDSEDNMKEDRAKLLFTAPRAREDSLPSDLIQKDIGTPQATYSFLELLANEGYETNDLEHFEEQVILKLDKLKEHILTQFNPIFNELNLVRKRLRYLAEQTAAITVDRRSIMK